MQLPSLHPGVEARIPTHVMYGRLQSRPPIFEKSYDELTKNLGKSQSYEKLRMSIMGHVIIKNLTKIV